MHTTMVFVKVLPDCIEAFRAATLKNHDGARREEGNIRFDVLQFADKPDEFLLYEVYADAEAAAYHKTTPHYLAWREEVAAYMAQPRRGEPMNVLAFD